MNKLQGFYELKKIGIPSVPWQAFTANITHLDPDLLWTIRVAAAEGNDFNLPRAVGVSAREAVNKGQELIKTFQEPDLVIYYPYFIALKSGTISIQEHRTIIEAVNQDLWNLTTAGRRDLTIIIDHDSGKISKYGNTAFLDESELAELYKYQRIIRAYNKQHLIGSSTVMVEWSYAMHSNVERQPQGDKYLVFYEYRVMPY